MSSSSPSRSSSSIQSSSPVRSSSPLESPSPLQNTSPVKSSFAVHSSSPPQIGLEAARPVQPAIYITFPTFETYRQDVMVTETFEELNAILATSAEDELLKIYDYINDYLSYENLRIQSSVFNLIAMDTLNKAENLKEKWRAMLVVDPRSTLDSRDRLFKIRNPPAATEQVPLRSPSRLY